MVKFMEEAPEVSLECKVQYLKDLSFENPYAPFSFGSQEAPMINVDYDIGVGLVDEEKLYEVVLHTTIHCKDAKNQVVVLISVSYAGLFDVANVPEEGREYILASYCPNLLFPYVRNIVSDLTTKGGYPPLYLTPVDFSAVKEISENNLPN